MMAEESGVTSEESGGLFGFRFWEFYRYQKPMVRVVLATLPAMAGAVYFFGWRALAVVLVSIVFGTLAEWSFCRKRGEPVSSAVFVTAVLYALILPPRVPYMVVIVGIVVGIVFGKEVFGGFARNVFNPALVGRCFVFVCFPVEMTGKWLAPYGGFTGGLFQWVKGVDAVTRATPLAQFKTGESVAALGNLFWGNVGGCLGETSALLVTIGGLYLLYTKTANWRIVVSCLVGAALTSAGFHYGGAATVPGPLFSLMSGGLLFGAFFMATDPISAAQTTPGRYIYGFLIGALIVIIRGFSGWAGGTMFAILLMNVFNPIMDHYVREIQQGLKAKAEGE
ncbi:MAG: RnfABCDGE type electron transport complex subunit D [Candidatus Brocadiia bacterium]